MSILVTFLGVTEHFSGKNGALRWSILVGKRKHNVQRPIEESAIKLYVSLKCTSFKLHANSFKSF